MREFTRYSLVFLSLLCMGAGKVSGEPPPGTPPPDTLFLYREPDATFMQSFREDTAFDYEQRAVNQTSLWDYILRWIIEKLLGQDVSSGTLSVLKWVLGLLFVLLLGWVIWRVLVNRHAIFRRGEKPSLPALELNVVDQDEDTVARMLQQAEQEGAYPLAVRLRFSILLHQMDQNGLITWRANKPNRHYIEEVANPEHRGQFAALCRIFEYVSYGEFSVNDTAYRWIVGRFTHFRREVEL